MKPEQPLYVKIAEAHNKKLSEEQDWISGPAIAIEEIKNFLFPEVSEDNSPFKAIENFFTRRYKKQLIKKLDREIALALANLKKLKKKFMKKYNVFITSSKGESLMVPLVATNGEKARQAVEELYQGCRVERYEFVGEWSEKDD